MTEAVNTEASSDINALLTEMRDLKAQVSHLTEANNTKLDDLFLSLQAPAPKVEVAPAPKVEPTGTLDAAGAEKLFSEMQRKQAAQANLDKFYAELTALKGSTEAASAAIKGVCKNEEELEVLRAAARVNPANALRYLGVTQSTASTSNSGVGVSTTNTEATRLDTTAKPEKPMQEWFKTSATDFWKNVETKVLPDAKAAGYKL